MWQEGLFRILFFVGQLWYFEAKDSHPLWYKCFTYALTTFSTYRLTYAVIDFVAVTDTFRGHIVSLYLLGCIATWDGYITFVLCELIVFYIMKEAMEYWEIGIILLCDLVWIILFLYTGMNRLKITIGILGALFIYTNIPVLVLLVMALVIQALVENVALLLHTINFISIY